MVQARLDKERLLNIASMWLEQHHNDLPFVPQPGLSEIQFQMPLTDDIIYCGTMDNIAPMKGSGNWVVVDLKTTRRVTQRWLAKWKMDTQVSGYISAAKEHVDKVLGMLIGVIELPDPKVSNSKCKIHGVPYTECDLFHAQFHWIGPITRTKEQLDSWRITAIQQARKYRELHRYYSMNQNKAMDQIPQEGMFTDVEYVNSCVSCECLNFCNDSRPSHLLDNYFKHEPWFCFQEMVSNGGSKNV